MKDYDYLFKYLYNVELIDVRDEAFHLAPKLICDT